MPPTSHYLTCEGREIHYMAWGDPAAEPVIAWHGLARTGRDMDDVAEHLAARYRVICPDTIGRGLSQWSPEPEREYCLAFYARLATRCSTSSASSECTGSAPRWAARSARRRRAAPLRGRIRSLVLNDNGAAARRSRDRAHPQLRRQPAGVRRP